MSPRALEIIADRYLQDRSEIDRLDEQIESLQKEIVRLKTQRSAARDRRLSLFDNLSNEQREALALRIQELSDELAATRARAMGVGHAETT